MRLKMNSGQIILPDENHSFWIMSEISKKYLGINDLEIDAHLLGPNNLSNFFGIGNNTKFINKGNRKMPYYRNRYDYLTVDFKLKRKIQR